MSETERIVPPNVSSEVCVRQIRVQATTKRDYAFMLIEGALASWSTGNGPKTGRFLIHGRESMRKVAEMILGHLEVSKDIPYRRKRKAGESE